MFGISFSELMLVGLVALLVLGPERLPGAARTAGLWVGRLKRSFNSIKQEVEREIGADDIRRQLHNEHIVAMEQEARKILGPMPYETAAAAEPAPAPHSQVAPSVNPQPTPSEGPAPTPAPATASPPLAGTPEHSVVSPAVAPASTPPTNDPTLPPRAP